MSNANNQYDARLDLVPQNPGVYLMKDAAGSVIYVGKAINLRNRLRSYFTPRPLRNAQSAGDDRQDRRFFDNPLQQ